MMRVPSTLITYIASIGVITTIANLILHSYDAVHIETIFKFVLHDKLFGTSVCLVITSVVFHGIFSVVSKKLRGIMFTIMKGSLAIAFLLSLVRNHTLTSNYNFGLIAQIIAVPCILMLEIVSAEPAEPPKITLHHPPQIQVYA